MDTGQLPVSSDNFCADSFLTLLLIVDADYHVIQRTVDERVAVSARCDVPENRQTTRTTSAGDRTVDHTVGIFFFYQPCIASSDSPTLNTSKGGESLYPQPHFAILGSQRFPIQTAVLRHLALQAEAALLLSQLQFLHKQELRQLIVAIVRGPEAHAVIHRLPFSAHSNGNPDAQTQADFVKVKQAFELANEAKHLGIVLRGDGKPVNGFAHEHLEPGDHVHVREAEQLEKIIELFDSGDDGLVSAVDVADHLFKGRKRRSSNGDDRDSAAIIVAFLFYHAEELTLEDGRDKAEEQLVGFDGASLGAGDVLHNQFDVVEQVRVARAMYVLQEVHKIHVLQVGHFLGLEV
jgi:hypothetical protein